MTVIALEMLDWFQSGHDPACYPMSARNGDATLVVVMKRNELQFYTRGPIPEKSISRFWTGGSGGDIALGAMHAGKTAREAVEIASIYCAWCGHGVDSFEL